MDLTLSQEVAFLSNAILQHVSKKLRHRIRELFELPIRFELSEMPTAQLQNHIIRISLSTPVHTAAKEFNVLDEPLHPGLILEESGRRVDGHHLLEVSLKLVSSMCLQTHDLQLVGNNAEFVPGPGVDHFLRFIVNSSSEQRQSIEIAKDRHIDSVVRLVTAIESFKVHSAGAVRVLVLWRGQRMQA